MVKRAELYVPPEKDKEIRLDIGCGRVKKEGFIGIDSLDFGQQIVHDVRKGLPMFEDNSVTAVESSHFVEHLTGEERVPFFNELWRVLKVGGTAVIITPSWQHSCAYGDPTHKWPPMSSWYPLYLNREWRNGNAPHTGYTCNFGHGVAGSWDGSLEHKNQEYKSFAMNNFVNGWRDLIITLTKLE